MNKGIYLLLFTFLAVVASFAQTPAGDAQNNLRGIARFHQGHIELRWAPTDYAAWQRGNKKGYIIERIGEDGITRLTTAPIKPYSLDEWAAKTDTSVIWNKAAAQLLYGKMKGLPEKPTLAQIQEISKIQNYQFANAVIAADMNSETARGMALSFVDNDVKPNRQYAYRILIAGAEIGKFDTCRVYIDTEKAWAKPVVAGLYAEYGEHQVMLKWNKSLSEPYFSAFWVEKSQDEGKTFRRLNPEPLFVSGFAKDDAVNFYQDSVETNYVPAHYRVIGITPWGDEGMPSETVKGMGRDLTPPGGANEVKVASTEANKVTITWDAAVNPSDLAGWYVRRSMDAAAFFVNVNEKPLPPSTRTFTDVEPYVFQSNFYQVVAVDTAGNEGESMTIMCKIVDSIPPAQPIGLIGRIDSNGVVGIAWDANNEPDLRGYRVYTAHGKNREFKQLTSAPIQENYLMDTITLRTLNEIIYYRVVAVDYSWNHSTYSEFLELKKPDIIPPLAPAFRHYSVSGNEVNLEWTNSSSKDLAKQILWRQKIEGEWQKVAEFSKPFPQTYTDKGLPGNQKIVYALEAVDDDGLASGKSNTLRVRAQVVRRQVEKLNAKIDPDNPSAWLSWSYEAENCRFVILRAQADEAFTSVQSIDGNTMNCQDVVSAKGTYRYAVKAVFSDGSESPLSEEIRVVFE